MFLLLFACEKQNCDLNNYPGIVENEFLQILQCFSLINIDTLLCVEFHLPYTHRL